MNNSKFTTKMETDREKYVKMMLEADIMLKKTRDEIEAKQQAGLKTVDMKEVNIVQESIREQIEKAGVVIPQQELPQQPQPIVQQQNTQQQTIASNGVIKRNVEVKTDDVINQKLKEENEAIRPQKSYSTYIPPTNLKRKYDLVPLPSKGQCYAHKIDKLPVYYMTAKEENYVFSLNLYQSGMVVDTILRSCIVNDEIDPNDLVPADIDAILLFLRSNAYGPEFPIETENPHNGQKIETNISLANIKYKPFELIGDEKGYFDYTTKSGDLIKYSYPTRGEVKMYEKLISDNHKEIQATKLDDVVGTLRTIAQSGFSEITPNDLLILDNAANNLAQMKLKLLKGKDSEAITNLLTITMLVAIKSINGNFDRQYCKEYVENMLAAESRGFRMLLDKNAPGLDFQVPVIIPQGQEKAGEQFMYDLPFDESIFINIAD